MLKMGVLLALYISGWRVYGCGEERQLPEAKAGSTEVC
jgi:hypothetical protein